MSSAVGDVDRTTSWPDAPRPWRAVALLRDPATGATTVCGRVAAIHPAGLSRFTAHWASVGAIVATWRVETLPAPVELNATVGGDER